MLTSNGEKILNLNGSIGQVKLQQPQLDQELDFILTQRKELEEFGDKYLLIWKKLLKKY